jgi:DnaK suppressor protein
MNGNDLERFWQILQRHLDEANELVSRVKAEGRALQQDEPKDIGDRSVSTFSTEILYGHGAQMRRVSRRIEAALDRIRQGSFGECLSCGVEINIKRLEAMPWAEYCRDCQETVEREIQNAPDEGNRKRHLRVPDISSG